MNCNPMAVLKGIYEPFSGTDLSSSGLVSEVNLRLRSTSGCPTCPADRLLGSWLLDALRSRIIQKLKRRGVDEVIVGFES